MGMGNMNKMMKQVQKMQAQMAKLQEELEERVVEASAGGEAVTVKVNGKQEVLEIKIDPDVVDPDDVEMLEDLVLAAVNEALRSAQEMVASEMGKITGGMNIPGLF
ncbi:MAG: YbaB/EbfC family nucleoid-associated protein [Bacillota bacterium]|jgi:DNA-binding YbaB/EbfC family protein